MSLPKDPYMLLSFVNTKLRDEYSSLDEFCKAQLLDKEDIICLLEKIDYFYDSDKNSFC